MFQRSTIYYARWFWATSYAIFFTVVAPAEETSESSVVVIEEQEITKYDRDHWAFHSITLPDIPKTSNPSWCNTAIDRFILAKLESEGIRPAPNADRSTLVRRIYWDLTGLPPKASQAQAFVNDDVLGQQEAYEKLVDRLLASPDYAQHTAQFWLDLARFAETDGFEHDKIRPTAWKYRDWVIKALGQDLPYDRFIQWQIAGDQLEPQNQDAQLATAFCVAGPDMPDINLMDERRHVLLNEMTSTVGSVVMALQVGCAQCHDHMYDSISQADFYRLRAFFDDAVKLEKNKSVTMLTSVSSDQPSRLMTRGDFRRPGPVVQASFLRLLNADERQPQNDAAKRAALAKWLTDGRHPLTARVIVNRIWQMHFGQGLVATPNDFGVLSDSPSHPELLDYLAAQLMNNGWSLKWLHREIVRSSVYQMASRFSDGVVSRQDWDESLEVDTANRLLSRYPRRRLTGEAIRDGMLQQSGMINSTMGGPGFRPPLPSDMVKTLLKGQWNVTEEPAEFGRRSVYLFARRNLRYPFFATFDRPSADQPCACRNESTTAVQSLTLFNSDLSMSAARRLAEELGNESSDIQMQIDDLFWRLFSRSPERTERQMAAEFLQSQQQLIEQQSDSIGESEAAYLAMVDLCRSLFNSNGFVYIE
ncbi:DUF1549 and DUF1553 domain-containing protein [Stieleria sp. JC731]|uniref:DUF1549 and DUF1553 domain-containing protein n=1 Tax=Pirellulaceae TaxID=2691357 RepID=UPI001E2CBC5E|nr:DUF1549 and DUF1553 domain-containing protein [Stieleria sp. JC731]MCC9602312.1 DUF1549 and DUF1553 domain-containing protein [Stieleria sp. JC731]